MFGDTVYVRAAAEPGGLEYGATVVSTESTRVLLAMPGPFWTSAFKVWTVPNMQRKRSKSRRLPASGLCARAREGPAGVSPPFALSLPACFEASNASSQIAADEGIHRIRCKSMGKSNVSSVQDAKPTESLLFHVRFTFDRTPLRRMHAALRVAHNPHFQMLPVPASFTPFNAAHAFAFSQCRDMGASAVLGALCVLLYQASRRLPDADLPDDLYTPGEEQVCFPVSLYIPDVGRQLPHMRRDRWSAVDHTTLSL